MIRVDETDPVGEIEPSFPYRDVTVRRGVDFKDHYDIESEIGRGKFGTVYRCKEKSGGLQLAAKVVNTARKEDRRAVEREVEIMRRLQHPRLIQLYDAIDTGKLIYVILELIEGGELFERVIDDDFVLTERSCAVFMRQICEGMEFVHAQNILHLDMKPENILCLTKEGNRIKIIDFGLARQYDPAKKLQVLFGTPEFVAPEVVNFDQIGFGTDMWSIGVICYVLLSGLSPFMGDTDIETMANVTIAKYDFDDEAFAEISDDAKDFIKCLLVKDKEGRLTASQCQKHPWLTRKYPPTSKILPKTAEVKRPKAEVELAEAKEELDMAKDNLRLFVERWREHPDSPYLIELDDHRWDPDAGKSLRNGVDETNNVELVSLRGHSPSPCGSICSSITSESASSPRDSGNYLTVQNLGFPFERRASDGQSQEKTKDHAAQIVLAEEIIKLSEHLRSIAMGPRVVCSGEKDKSERQTLAPGSTASGKVANSSKSASNSTKVIGGNFDSPPSAKASSKIGKERVTAEREKLPRTASMKRNGSVSSETNEISEKLSTITNQRKLNGTTFNGVRNFERSSETSSASSFTLKRRTSRPKTDTGAASDSSSSSTQESTRNDRLFDHKETSKTSSFLRRTDSRRDHSSSSAKTEADLQIPPFQKSEREVDLTPPWRRARAKHRFGETCRDVPRISNLQDMHQNLNLDEPASTKNLLLQLLNEWDDVSRPSRVGRKSVSVDWCGGESIARRSMNSLAEYFQSEQKRPASGVSSTTPPSSSIHR